MLRALRQTCADSADNGNNANRIPERLTTEDTLIVYRRQQSASKTDNDYRNKILITNKNCHSFCVHL